jgi:SAM-dependent methyltransferase
MNPARTMRRAAWQASMLGLRRGPHITRYFMYQRLRKIGAELQLRPGRVVSVSHSEPLAELLAIKAEEMIIADYPEQNLLSLGMADDSVDYVVSDQVLEHVEGNPYQAVAECHRILRPGGVSVLTTCFINPIHGCPSDFWRFTPEALTLLHQGWSEVIEVGGWGNFEAWSVIRDGLRFEGVPDATWHPLHRIAMHNDPLWPIVTWIIARK